MAEDYATLPKAQPIDARWIQNGQGLRYTFAGRKYGEFQFRAWVLEVPLSWYLRGLITKDILAVRHAAPPSASVIRAYATRQSLPRLVLSGGRIRYVSEQYRRYYIEIKGAFPEYLSKFSSHHRKNLLRSVRKFPGGRDGVPQWRQYRSAEEMGEFYAVACAVSKKSWQEKFNGTSFAARPLARVVKFGLDDVARGYALFVDDKPVAAAFCRRSDDTLTYEWVAYDPDYSEHSPGTVLLLLIIQKLFSDRDLRFLDFDESEQWYKKHFSTGMVLCARVVFLPMRPVPLLAVAAHILINGAAYCANILLEKFRLRDAVRRVLRSRIQSR